MPVPVLLQGFHNALNRESHKAIGCSDNTAPGESAPIPLERGGRHRQVHRDLRLGRSGTHLLVVR